MKRTENKIGRFIRIYSKAGDKWKRAQIIKNRGKYLSVMCIPDEGVYSKPAFVPALIKVLRSECKIICKPKYFYVPYEWDGETLKPVYYGKD